ncbi:hypothetical protein BLNAU_7631 [Blattamonas nauphoetae]|uniref:Uncharacterized protein n=1 Tax=Blattamonas nauphoetae TaxID=2049346 RepID=A0ABQ9Y1D7_9EUKA|nr:hypothetical protein BLNAU_7631 [Blattamonas nauphoetae]
MGPAIITLICLLCFDSSAADYYVQFGSKANNKCDISEPCHSIDKVINSSLRFDATTDIHVRTSAILATDIELNNPRDSLASLTIESPSGTASLFGTGTFKFTATESAPLSCTFEQLIIATSHTTSSATSEFIVSVGLKVTAYFSDVTFHPMNSEGSRKVELLTTLPKCNEWSGKEAVVLLDGGVIGSFVWQNYIPTMGMLRVKDASGYTDKTIELSQTFYQKSTQAIFDIKQISCDDGSAILDLGTIDDKVLGKHLIFTGSGEIKYKLTSDEAGAEYHTQSIPCEFEQNLSQITTALSPPIYRGNINNEKIERSAKGKYLAIRIESDTYKPCDATKFKLSITNRQFTHNIEDITNWKVCTQYIIGATPLATANGFVETEGGVFYYVVPYFKSQYDRYSLKIEMYKDEKDHTKDKIYYTESTLAYSE